MSGDVSQRKRLLAVGEAALRERRIFVHRHAEFLAASGATNERRSLTMELEGLGERVETVVKWHAEADAPVAWLDGADWTQRFFEKHKICTGDILAIERVTLDQFRLYPFQNKPEREAEWAKFLHTEPEGAGPRLLELFSGCGGMALGFKQAGFRTALAVEWDRAACETLRANISERVAQCAIQEVDVFPDAEVIAGGPPCQGFSNLGERVPYDPRVQLWRHYFRALEQVRPRVFVMENVPPLLKSQEFLEMVKVAKGLGYDVVAEVLNSADYGVPQTRKRAIVVGVLGGRASLPEPTHANPDKVDLFAHRRDRWRTVRDAIADLPADPTGEDLHFGRNPRPMSIRRYRSVPPGGNRFDLPIELQPECWKRKKKGGTDLFGRLWWDRPSVTIRTEFYKPEKGRYLHPVEHRPITHREAARLQGFPDDFEFRGSKIQIGVQIGNAVPPPLARVLAEHAKSLLEGAGTD